MSNSSWARERVCSICKEPLAEGRSYWHEWGGNDYFTTYLYCESCKQWYEEDCVDQKSLGSVTKFKPISKAKMESGCSYHEKFVPPFEL